MARSLCCSTQKYTLFVMGENSAPNLRRKGCRFHAAVGVRRHRYAVGSSVFAGIRAEGAKRQEECWSRGMRDRCGHRRCPRREVVRCFAEGGLPATHNEARSAVLRRLPCYVAKSVLRGLFFRLRVFVSAVNHNATSPMRRERRI